MKKQRLLFCVLIAANLALIWGNSALPGGTSLEISDGFLAVLARYCPILAKIGSHLIRKLGHFSEFACLGFLLAWFFRLMGERGLHSLVMPAFFGLMAACMDETIQRFIPGRGSNLIDVWIDFSGVCTGIVLLSLGYCCIRRRKKEKKNM